MLDTDRAQFTISHRNGSFADGSNIDSIEATRDEAKAYAEMYAIEHAERIGANTPEWSAGYFGWVFFTSAGSMVIYSFY